MIGEGKELLSLKKNTYLKCVMAISFFLLKGIFSVEHTITGCLSGSVSWAAAS